MSSHKRLNFCYCIKFYSATKKLQYNINICRATYIYHMHAILLFIYVCICFSNIEWTQNEFAEKTESIFMIFKHFISRAHVFRTSESQKTVQLWIKVELFGLYSEIFLVRTTTKHAKLVRQTREIQIVSIFVTSRTLKYDIMHI